METWGADPPRRSIRESVYSRLKARILSGELAPGERLAEEHLAEELGVSRTPVREALQKLATEGFIRPLPTRGFRVAGDSREEMVDIFELRAVLEAYALRLASERISTEHLEALEEFIDQAEKAYRNKDIDGVFHWNTRFHDTLNDLVSHRPRLHRLIADLRKYVLRYRKDTLHYLSGARRSIDGHKKILLALRLGDPDLLEKMMREHVREAQEDALHGLEDAPTDPQGSCPGGET
ncbi:MAG: GntR family transcriptional regulator [Thermodesulfobacteriota bacterium]